VREGALFSLSSFSSYHHHHRHHLILARSASIAIDFRKPIANKLHQMLSKVISD